MMKYFPVFYAFSVQLFFSISSLIGFHYEGSESSSVYIIYNIILFILALIFIFVTTFVSNFKVNKIEFTLVLIPFIVTFIYLTSNFFSMSDEIGTTRYLYFILWVAPTIYMTIYFNQFISINTVARFMEILMLIFSGATIINTIQGLFTGDIISIGGATYQYASYLAAFSFGLNLYFLQFGHYHQRFKFTNLKLYKVFCIFLLPIQLVGTISGGGRGAIILLIVYLIYFSVFALKRTSYFIKYSIFLTFLVSVLYFILPMLFRFDLFELSLKRAFSYVSSDGINWNETSGREEIYTKAFDYVMDSPIWGYGMFGMFKSFDGYPHNMFLEILLQGGILYLVLWLLLLGYILFKLNALIKERNEYRIIWVIFLYPLILLAFSGTYINNSIFWFCISYILSVKVFSSATHQRGLNFGKIYK